MGDEFRAVAAAGSRRAAVNADAMFPHRWTDEGVAVQCDFTGAHLLHLSAAACVLNDVYREAAACGVVLDGVVVSATGGFDPETWASTGITYAVEIDSPSPETDVAGLIARVDEVAEIPRALRAGLGVRRR